MTKEQFEKVLFNKDTRVSFRGDVYRVTGVNFDDMKISIKEDRGAPQYDLKSEHNVPIEAVELEYYIVQTEITACMTVDRTMRTHCDDEQGEVI